MEQINKQSADTILMVEPVSFGFNEQTALDNYFQIRENVIGVNIQNDALNEFNELVVKLENNGIEVIVVKDTLNPLTPDSIFPNNWVSFQHDGRVILYPMCAENRRRERRQEIFQLLKDRGFRISDILDYSHFEEKGLFLEGTGSMVLDHKNRVGYAALSHRTDKDLFEDVCMEIGYDPICFTANQTVVGKRLPIYHTNVMMCIGDNFAVVCLDTLDKREERWELEKSLIESGKELIEISEKQMHYFAGNMLQVQGRDEIPYLVMSESAHNIFSKAQIKRLESYNELIIAKIPTIEKYGGGGVRCMMAEVFCPRISE